MAFRVRAGVVLLFLLTNFALSAEDQQLNPRDQAWAILRGGLEARKATKRLEAVKALSLITGDRSAVRFALRALQDKDGRVRTAAAASLGQLHATSAAPALKESLSDKDISVVLAATHSLFLLKDKSAYGVYYAILMRDKKGSEGVIQGQLDRLKDPKQVAELGFQEGLGFVPFGGMGFEAYRTIMKRDSAPVRAAAARFLALDPDPTSGDALVQAALADKDQIVRQAALDALAERGDPSCIERLLKNLSDDKDAVRYRTAATILRLITAAKRAKRRRPAK
jgi:HEAT repeat protein